MEEAVVRALERCGRADARLHAASMGFLEARAAFEASTAPEQVRALTEARAAYQAALHEWSDADEERRRLAGRRPIARAG